MKALRPILERFSRHNREAKAAFAESFMKQHGLRSVLLVGVDEPHGRWATANLVERRIGATTDQVIACGLHEHDESWIEYVAADALDLPFAANEFDLVYSNAVIEHVGGIEEQRRFIAEHARVGRGWIATTPNRLFPVESHTLTVGHHVFRSWSHPGVTRLLSKWDLRELLPANARIRGTHWAPTLTAYAPPPTSGTTIRSQ